MSLESEQHSTPSLTFERSLPDDSELADIRTDLYHSSGPGYYVLREFIPEDWADHLVKFWTEGVHVDEFCRWLSDIYQGCPNHAMRSDDGNELYNNFFWNEPRDEATHVISHYILQLRNKIMGRRADNELTESSQRRAYYRVVNAKNGTPVPPHRDWVGDTFDYSRIQATLVLSEHGRDYEGDGFRFETMQGDRILMGKDLNLKRGDLVFWRYNNEHSVRNVATTDDQIGFLRVIYPPDIVQPKLTLRDPGEIRRTLTDMDVLKDRVKIAMHRNPKIERLITTLKP